MSTWGPTMVTLHASWTVSFWLGLGLNLTVLVDVNLRLEWYLVRTTLSSVSFSFTLCSRNPIISFHIPPFYLLGVLALNHLLPLCFLCLGSVMLVHFFPFRQLQPRPQFLLIWLMQPGTHICFLSSSIFLSLPLLMIGEMFTCRISIVDFSSPSLFSSLTQFLITSHCTKN